MIAHMIYKKKAKTEKDKKLPKNTLKKSLNSKK
jgi:hypothetical protein